MKVDYSASIPETDDFKAWCEHPVTKFVALANHLAIEDLKRQWEMYSWDGYKSDSDVLLKLKCRADGLSVLLNAEKEDYERYVTEARQRNRT